MAAKSRSPLPSTSSPQRRRAHAYYTTNHGEQAPDRHSLTECAEGAEYRRPAAGSAHRHHPGGLRPAHHQQHPQRILQQADGLVDEISQLQAYLETAASCC
ncbi:MAG: hypothetical protein ACLVJH_08985 [Faecalibacterium prausnitzii]